MHSPTIQSSANAGMLEESRVPLSDSAQLLARHFGHVPSASYPQRCQPLLQLLLIQTLRLDVFARGNDLAFRHPRLRRRQRSLHAESPVVCDGWSLNLIAVRLAVPQDV